MGMFDDLFGSSRSGVFNGSGIVRENPISRATKKIVREKTAEVAEKISPTLGKVVRAVNQVEEVQETILHGPNTSSGEMLFTNLFKDNTKKVSPISGSIVYCGLAAGHAEHSGVYIGGGRIVELNGNGRIVEVSARQFTDNITTVDKAIYVSSTTDGSNAIGHSTVAYRAQSMLGKERNYNLIMDNCHQFTAGCILNDFNNSNNFFWMLNDVVKTKINDGDTVQWLVWDWGK